MSMIKCPECQKEISNTSKSCPNCGCPITSGTNTLKQQEDIQTEIYKTAFIQSVIIAIEAIIVPILYWLLNTLRGTASECISAFNPAGENLATNMVMISLRALIIIEILWIVKKKKHKTELEFICKYNTIFLTWGSYAFTYCLGLLIQFCSPLARSSASWWEFYKPLFIQVIIVILIVLIGIILFAKEMNFKKYAIVFMIWGIYAILILCLSIISLQTLDFIYYSFRATMLILPVSIVMGILWVVSSNKTKTK